MDRRKIVRVTSTEFEMDNGSIYPHPVPLDQVPSVEDFQETYDCWFQLFQDKGWIGTDEEPPEKEEPKGRKEPKTKSKRDKTTR
jgi:hypothetical protein